MSADYLSIPTNPFNNSEFLLETFRTLRIQQQVSIANYFFHRYPSHLTDNVFEKEDIEKKSQTENCSKITNQSSNEENRETLDSEHYSQIDFQSVMGDEKFEYLRNDFGINGDFDFYLLQDEKFKSQKEEALEFRFD